MRSFGSIFLFMNKKTVFLFIPFLLRTSCAKSEDVYSLSVGYIRSDRGLIRVNDSSTETLPPFNTSIEGRVYYYDGDYTKKQLYSLYNDFSYAFQYCHALSDRHYSYSQYDESGNFVRTIENVYSINQSYGTETPVKVDPFLYDLIKKSYSFSLASEGKFNRFLGTLNDIYEAKLKTLGAETETSTDYRKNDVLFQTTGRRFSSFSATERNRIATITESLPKTKEERKDILTFDDATSSVTFHKYKNVKKLEISLGGNAKGFATEYFADKVKKEYPNISRIINSGNSSVKAIGQRPDGREWKINYINPLSKENYQDKYNNSEVVISKNGEFNLSTSGYYEQYFYSYLPDENGIYHPEEPFVRNSHIINPKTGYSCSHFDQISVFLNDAGLADRYTTALRNTESLADAKALLERLNLSYEITDADLMLCRKSVKNSDGELYSYKMSDYSPLQENALPVVETENGSYSGDFSDLKSLPKKYLSTYHGSFEEDYYRTSDRFKRAEISQEKLTKEVVSVLKELK